MRETMCPVTGAWCSCTGHCNIEALRSAESVERRAESSDLESLARAKCRITNGVGAWELSTDDEKEADRNFIRLLLQHATDESL